MAVEIDQALFTDTLAPGYNSFNEALANAVVAAMRKRREQGIVNTEHPKGENETPENVVTEEETAVTEKVAAVHEGEAPEVQESPTQEGLGLDETEVVEGEVVTEETEKTQAESSDKIQDFGEKLGGARKDLYQRYRDMIMQVNEDELSKYPLAKLWPQPNYSKLLEEGIDNWRVAILRALREDMPRRPNAMSYKIRSWNNKFLYNRSIAEEVLDVELNANTFDDYIFVGNSHFSSETITKAFMYQRLGADTPEKDFPYFVRYFGEFERIYLHDESHSNCYCLMSGRFTPVQVFDSYSDALNVMIAANEKAIEEKKIHEEVLQKIAEKLEIDTSEKKEERKYDKFEIRGWRAPKSYWFIGKKYNGEWVELKKPFETGKEAREYLASHKDEIQDLWEQFKFVPNLRRTENLPRTEDGNPARARDITPEEFAEAFGFRGVEFGNWVEDKKRQQDLNEAYDGLMDLAGVLNVPPKALSLCGELGLRFGSNGRGGKNAAKAHYEPDLIAINLTKKAGAGSLAHEWFHAMDHYFNRHVGENKSTFNLLTETQTIENLIYNIQMEQHFKESGNDYYRERAANRQKEIYDNSLIRREVLEKFVGLLQSFDKEVPDVKNTYQKRSKGNDKFRSKPYWGTKVEMAARAFEAYVCTKLEEKGIRNDYLANYLTPDEYDSVAERNPARLSGYYPYPVKEEMVVIKKAFDDLFETMDTRDTADGKVELYSSSDYRRSRLEQCETVFDEELSEAQRDLKDFAIAVLEQDVEFFDGPECFHGSYDPLENKILLNINSEKPVDWVLWHESFHAFGALEPETYKELMDYMDANAPITKEQIEAYKESVKGYDLPDNVVKQELLADAFADMKKRQTTMEQMKDKAPGLFGKVSRYFSKVKELAKDFFFEKEEVKLTKEQFAVFEQGVNDIAKLHPSPILEGDGASLEMMMRVAQRCEDRNRNRMESDYSKEKQYVQKRLKVLDFTPLQQKDFDIQFAKDSIRNGARTRDVEYVLKNVSSLGEDKKVMSDIMREAKAAYAR